jgi:hypothetical protein
LCLDAAARLHVVGLNAALPLFLQNGSGALQFVPQLNDGSSALTPTEQTPAVGDERVDSLGSLA